MTDSSTRPVVRRRTGLLAVLALALALPTAACEPDPSPTPPTSTAPSGPTTTGPGGLAGTIKFRVVDEYYTVGVVSATQLGMAREMLAGSRSSMVPNGRVADGDGGVNSPHAWHIDPESFEFADATMEVCDGRPSDVDAHLITSEYYCPWAAQVVEVVPPA